MVKRKPSLASNKNKGIILLMAIILLLFNIPLIDERIIGIILVLVVAILEFIY